MAKIPKIKLNRNRLLKKWEQYDFGKEGKSYRLQGTAEEAQLLSDIYTQKTKKGVIATDYKKRYVDLLDNKGKKLARGVVTHAHFNNAKDLSKGATIDVLVRPARKPRAK